MLDNDVCAHDWRRTGEFFATNPPTWIVVCACGAAGKQYDTGDVKIMQLSGCEQLPGARDALRHEGGAE